MSRSVVFGLRIDALKNMAHHSIDGKAIKVTELREEAKKFNIQVDNPCTFLAQDKVKSFAEQGPQKLLRNTEKASIADLSTIHDELNDIAEEGSEFEDKLNQLRKRMEHIEVELKTKKARVENFLEWEALNKTLGLLKKKRALIEYEQQLERQRESMAEVDEAQSVLDREKKKLAPIEKSIRNIENTLKEVERDLTKLKLTKNATTSELKKLLKHSSMDDKLKEAADKLQTIQRNSAEWDTEKDEISKTYQEFKDMHERKKHAYMPRTDLAQTEAGLKKQFEELKKEEAAIIAEQKDIFRRNNELHSRQNAQRSSMEIKLENLVRLRKNADVFKAWDFYSKNKDQFRGPVFVPYLHLQVPASDHLDYFNNVIGTRDLAIFIFSNREDEELLLSKFRVDTSIITEDMIDEFRRAKQQVAISDGLRELGFVDFLLNFLRAPDPVGAYLNGNFNMDKILIGTPAIEEDYENRCKSAKQMDNRLGIFLTKRFRIEVSYSRFDRQKVYIERKPMNTNQRINADHTKSFGADDAEALEQIAQQKRQSNERNVARGRKKEELQMKVQELREKKLEEERRKAEIEHIYGQMKKFEDRLKEFSSEKPDLAKAKEDYEELKRRIADEAIGNYEQIIQLLEDQRKSVSSCAILQDEIARLKAQKKILETQKAGHTDDMAKLTQMYKNKMKALADVKDDVNYAKNSFKEMAGFSPAENELANEQQRKMFAKMHEDFESKEIPDDLDALEEMYRKEQTRSTRGRQEGTQKDVDEYKKLEKDRTEVAANLAKTSEKNERWKQKIDAKLADWVHSLRELVASISTNFSNFFARLKCAGEVHLEEPENKYKLEEYGIKILVKFRNGTSLRELNPQTQSGGERSVSTMLYIMALQDLCLVPFRCVDEINQGMDPQNERAVFNMMVNLLNTGQNVSKTQYFLLTPKLLSGLDFNERVTVHVIHNGPAIENAEHWDPERFLASEL